MPEAPFQDANLSWQAKGVYAALIATAQEAEMAGPRVEFARAGTTAKVNATLDELVRHGYIRREKRVER